MPLLDITIKKNPSSQTNMKLHKKIYENWKTQIYLSELCVNQINPPIKENNSVPLRSIRIHVGHSRTFLRILLISNLFNINSTNT